MSELIALPFLLPPQAGWFSLLWRASSQPSGTPIAWLLAAGIAAASVIYSSARSFVVRNFAFRPATWMSLLGIRLLAIPMSFVTGFFEEIFFRKVLMDLLDRESYGAAAQVLASAAIFGVVHAIWALFGGRFRAAAAIVMVTGVLGGALAMVYLVGGRSIAPCIAAHIGLNLILEPWLVLSSATGAWGKKGAQIQWNTKPG